MDKGGDPISASHNEKLSVEELERDIISSIAEMDDYEGAWNKAKRNHDPLADKYYSAFIKAGLRLAALRDHRDMAIHRRRQECLNT